MLSPNLELKVNLIVFLVSPNKSQILFLFFSQKLIILYSSGLYYTIQIFQIQFLISF